MSSADSSPLSSDSTARTTPPPSLPAGQNEWNWRSQAPVCVSSVISDCNCARSTRARSLLLFAGPPARPPAHSRRNSIPTLVTRGRNLASDQLLPARPAGGADRNWNLNAPELQVRVEECRRLCIRGNSPASLASKCTTPARRPPARESEKRKLEFN